MWQTTEEHGEPHMVCIMKQTNNMLVIGGDLRFVYTAVELNKRFNCSIFGFDLNDDDSVCKENGVTVIDELKPFDNVLLPLPVSRNCDYITSPYYSGEIPISDIVKAAKPNATVYCGKACQNLKDLCDKHGFTLIDYFDREELIVLNAAITAEGVIEIILREQARTIMNMNILVTGYGRISRALSANLKSLGANVTVCARKFSDLSWARIAGCKAVHIDDIDPYLETFDTVVNTVPAQILYKSRLIKLKKDCLIVDVASKTGIEDMRMAKEAGVKVIWALSIPGKVAPITAGEIIADTVFNIIRERELKSRERV